VKPLQPVDGWKAVFGIVAGRFVLVTAKGHPRNEDGLFCVGLPLLWRCPCASAAPYRVMEVPAPVTLGVAAEGARKLSVMEKSPTGVLR